jgi:hypothetical protein
MGNIERLEAGLEEMGKRRKEIGSILPRERKALERIEERLAEAEDAWGEALAKGRESAKTERVLGEARKAAETQAMKVRGLESEIAKIDSRIGEDELLLRKESLAEDEAAIADDLVLISKLQEEQVGILKRISEREIRMRGLVLHRRERRRIDVVRVKILDRKLRDQYGERRSAVKHEFPKGRPSFETETLIPATGDVFQRVGYGKAMEWVRAGKAEIVEEREPKWESAIVHDPYPEILGDIDSLNLGRPVTIRGEMTSFFREMHRRVGWSMDLTTAMAFQLFTEAEMRKISGA